MMHEIFIFIPVRQLLTRLTQLVACRTRVLAVVFVLLILGALWLGRWVHLDEPEKFRTRVVLHACRGMSEYLTRRCKVHAKP